jgi:hypothetical protein
VKKKQKAENKRQELIAEVIDFEVRARRNKMQTQCDTNCGSNVLGE